MGRASSIKSLTSSSGFNTRKDQKFSLVQPDKEIIKFEVSTFKQIDEKLIQLKVKGPFILIVKGKIFKTNISIE